MPKPSPAVRRRLLGRPLDTILAGASHVAVLRVLAPTRAGATGREIARQAGIDPHSALDALAALEQAGLVRRQTAGRAYLFTLNRNHYLWQKALNVLFPSERSFQDEVIRVIESKLKNKVVSAAIFGSTSRGEDRPESDLDLCLIVENRKDEERALALAGKASPEVYERFGRHLAPLVFSREAFRRRLRSKDSLARSILADAIHVTGQDLRKLARG